MSAWSPQPSRRAERLLQLESLVRAQFALMLACVVVLALTGLPQKFESLAVSRSVIDAAGGIENLRLVHRVAGGALVLAGVYHIVLVLAAVLVLKETAPLRMVPDGRDIRDAMRATAYLAGLQRERPGPEGRRYFQKLDYWFLAWGLGVMALTGFVNLFPLRVASLLSSDTALAALRSHSDAAPLVLVWVVIVHVMYTGLTPRLFQTEESRQPAAAPETLAVQPLAGAMGIVSSTPVTGARDAGAGEEST